VAFSGITYIPLALDWGIIENNVTRTISVPGIYCNGGLLICWGEDWQNHGRYYGLYVISAGETGISVVKISGNISVSSSGATSIIIQGVYAGHVGYVFMKRNYSYM